MLYNYEKNIYNNITLFLMSVGAGDLFNMHYSSPSLFVNESKYTRIKISTFKTETAQELTIKIIDDDGLVVEIIGNDKLTLYPSSSISFDLFIKNEEKTLFKKYKKILLEINTNDQIFIEKVNVSIIPQPFIWPIIGLFLSLIMIAIFIVVFKKLQSGETK